MAAYAALLSVMNIIDNLELHPQRPLSLHKNQAYLLTQKISFLQEFLQGYNPHLAYSNEADPMETRIVDAAHAAEDLIESHIVDRVHQIIRDRETMNLDMLFEDHMHAAGDVIETHRNVDQTDAALYEALEKVIEDMALIEKEAMEMISEQTQGVKHQLQAKSTPSDSSGTSSSIVQQSKMVGADELLLQMKDRLKSDRLSLQTVPIVGMGGSGKTTLARNIYQDPLIKEHFHIRAWVTISQEYNIREILEQILKQLDKETSQYMSNGDLGDMLHRTLFGRKYLIILDDMWNIDAWVGVKMFLPDSKNGSRVVVTTRLSNMASELPNSDSLEMNLLDEASSWDLFSRIAFGEDGCPPELEVIGNKISKSCKGLPLSIVVVGGLLAKSRRTIEFWEDIEENINSIVNLDDGEHCLKILHMSYKQLPIYLKPCFLYMGVYSEDEEIRISKLIKLWVAEGFIRPVKGKSLEEIAKEYLKDLISRNLILINDLVASTGIMNNMKYCKIHDLLRDLSLREAEKERFYTRNPPQGIVNGQRRIVVSSEEAIENAFWSSMPLARSFIWHVLSTQKPPVLNLKLLRIFNYSYDSIEKGSEFLESMHQLVNSRFFAFSAKDCILPSSIWLFWNLQTLLVKGTMEITAPTDIWCMPHLRHVQVNCLHLPKPPKGQDDMVLENLQTLGSVMSFNCSKRVVKRIPNIKKLKISYEGLHVEGYFLTNLDCLDKLESLSCTFDGWMLVDDVQSLINFPQSLKKLSLNVDGSVYWEGILDKIGELPFLRELKLEGGTFKEKQWETSEGQFRSLRYLGVRDCWGLHVWATESSHFPCLNHLFLKYLYKLEEIPLDFAEISTLKVIEMIGCTDSSVKSAKRIVEEQEESYGEEATLQVQVTLTALNDDSMYSLATNINFRVL